VVVVAYTTLAIAAEIGGLASVLVVAGLATVLGALLVVAGLTWLAVAAIVRRRVLPQDRYRGASLINLLVLAVVAGTLASAPLLVITGGDPRALDSPGVVTVELLLTPVTFLVVYGLFIALPRALPGVRLWIGAASLRQLAVGAGLGLLVWLAMGVLSEIVNLIVSAISGQSMGGEQAVAGLAQEVPMVTAVALVAVLAPIAEELFFRGAVLNAWEREYGTRRAIVGSAALFAVVHVDPTLSGTQLVLVIAQIFLLGLVLGTMYARTRTLTTTIGIHGAFNLASVLALFLVRP
jgi:membrane protease YdiL (CAAX protease family)